MRNAKQEGRELPEYIKVRVTAPKRLQAPLGKLAEVRGPRRRYRAQHHWEGEVPSVPGVGREGGNPSQPHPFPAGSPGGWAPPHRGGTGSPTARPKKLDPGQGRLRRAKLTPGAGQSGPLAMMRTGLAVAPSMVSVAGGRTVPCCSDSKLAALTVGTVLLLTGIGAASWAIGESGQTPCTSTFPCSLVAPLSLPALTSAFSQ